MSNLCQPASTQPEPSCQEDFTGTHWTQVRLAANQDGSPEAHQALEAVCLRYWPAIYSFLRRKNHHPTDAEDVTQGFFSQLLQENGLARADRGKGRFRNFLLGALRRFLVDQRRRNGAQKRGYGKVVLALDFREAEAVYLDEADLGLTPEEQYDRRWATTVLETAFAELDSEFQAAGQSGRFEGLKRFLSEAGGAADYAAIGARLGLKPKAVSTAVSRLRERYRELVMRTVSATVGRAHQLAPGVPRIVPMKRTWLGTTGPPSSQRRQSGAGAILERASRCPRCDTKLRQLALGGLCSRCVGRRLVAGALDEWTSRLASYSTTEPPAVGEWAGLELEGFMLMEKLGEGGSGEVHAAEQLRPVRRRVAVKILKSGRDRRATLARFAAEREALAKLDHPDIVKLLDAGYTKQGRPYLAMELVPGLRITEYCDRHRLDTNFRLDLFIRVCHAVQHAHESGILHLDLKPANILVTTSKGAPSPKLIDFSIAEFSGQALSSVSRQRNAAFGRQGAARLSADCRLKAGFEFIASTGTIPLGRIPAEQPERKSPSSPGTPAYMSPEQAEWDGKMLSVGSDIYSLGLVLNELLTGQTVFTPIPEIQSSKVPFAMRGELNRIVMKCLEKNPTRRYDCAAALLQELRSLRKNGAEKEFRAVSLS